MIRNGKKKTRSQKYGYERPVSNSLKLYFKTPDGIAAREKNSVQRREEWHRFLQSEEGDKCKQEFKKAWINFVTNMHKFTKEN